MRQHPSQYNLRMPARPAHHPIPASSPLQLHHGSQHGPITPVSHSQAHSYSSRNAAPRQHISSPHIIRHTVPHSAQVTWKFLFYHHNFSVMDTRFHPQHRKCITKVLFKLIIFVLNRYDPLQKVYH